MAKRASTGSRIKTVTVGEVVQWASQGMLDIPEFQRDFVWKPQDVKRLADSLYRDYPIGSFLLWETPLHQHPRNIWGENATPDPEYPRKNKKPLWIVDGQQRITALCLLLGKRPSWWRDQKPWDEFAKQFDVWFTIAKNDQDAEVEFAFPNPTHTHKRGWFSLRRFLNREEREETIVKNISRGLEDKQIIYAELQKLRSIVDRKISCTITKHALDDVAEIFTRLNQAGKRVKEADVVLALAGVHNPRWISEKFLPFRKDLEQQGWKLETGVIIRTLTCIGEGRADLSKVRKSFWMPKNMDKNWDKTKSVIKEVLEKLLAYGIASNEVLPSTNSLIPLFVLHCRWRRKRGYSFCKALHWFLLANKVGRYSGSAITRINEDVKAIRESNSFSDVLNKLQKRLQLKDKKISSEEFKGRYDTADNRFLKLMLFLILIDRKACDWHTDRCVMKLYEDKSAELHHIYPRDVLKREGVDDEKINSLANITILENKTNKELSNRLPNDYMKQIKKDYLDAHCIPPIPARPRDADLARKYERFLEMRSRRLAKAANELLKALENDRLRPCRKQTRVGSVRSSVGTGGRAKRRPVQRQSSAHSQAPSNQLPP